MFLVALMTKQTPEKLGASGPAPEPLEGSRGDVPGARGMCQLLLSRGRVASSHSPIAKVGGGKATAFLAEQEFGEEGGCVCDLARQAREGGALKSPGLSFCSWSQPSFLSRKLVWTQCCLGLMMNAVSQALPDPGRPLPL